MQVQLPHKFKPRPYQLPFLKAWDSGSKRFFMLVWHRRSGKDKTVFAHIPSRMFERVGLYLYFLPTYTQANKVLWKGADKDGMRFLDHFPKEIIKNINETEMRIELVNGSIVQLVGADNIDRIVGTNPIGVVFSEFSLMKAQVWSFIRPILAENGGWAVFIYTPRGKNHAHVMHMQAKDNPLWFAQVLTVEDTGAISKEAIEEERRTMPQALFEQEYYCKYLEGAGQFFRRIRENTYDPDKIQLPERGDFQLGVDLAKYQDFTVLTPFSMNHFIAYPQERFNQVDWNLQKARIEATSRRFGEDTLVIPDSTGVGDPIVEDLKLRGLNIYDEVGFKFTETSRRQLLDNLAILLEQGKIKIPNDEGLISELESFRYELTERGTLKVGCPEGLHDDRVMSLALAVWGAKERVKPDYALMDKVYHNRQQPKTFK